MSLLLKCEKCGRENIGGDSATGICHRCRDSKQEVEEVGTYEIDLEANENTEE